MLAPSRRPRARRLRHLMFGCLIAIASAVPALGQSSDPELRQVPLNPARVESYLRSHADLSGLVAKFEPKYGRQDVEDGDDPVLAIEGWLDKPDVSAETQAILKRHGYPTFADWARVAKSVILAYGVADAGGQGSSEDEKAKAIAEIKADRTLTEEQRRQQIRETEEAFAALGAFAPLPGNVEAVRPFTDRIRKAIGID